MTREAFPGLTSREVATLVREVSTGIPYPDESSVVAAAARAALSAAFEPGDTDAALVVGSSGLPWLVVSCRARRVESRTAAGSAPARVPSRADSACVPSRTDASKLSNEPRGR